MSTPKFVEVFDLRYFVNIEGAGIIKVYQVNL